MLTTVRRSRPKGPLRAVPGATNNRKIGGRLCYCDKDADDFADNNGGAAVVNEDGRGHNSDHGGQHDCRGEEQTGTRTWTDRSSLRRDMPCTA